MKSLLLFLNFILLSTVVFGTTYYSSSIASDPNDLSNWWTNTNNTGTHPSNFSGSDIFQIQAGHTYATSATWTISYNLEIYGTFTADHTVNIGTDLIIYSGGSGLIISTGVSVYVDDDILQTGDITFAGTGSLYVSDDYTNTGTLTPATGTIIYDGTTSSTIKNTTYNDLVITKSTGYDVDVYGTITVLGDLTITNGDIDMYNSSVLNVTGATTLAENASIQFDDTTGDVNLAALYMTGGQLGGWDDGIVDCSSLTITGATNLINRVNLTVSGATTVTGTLNFNSGSGTKVFQGDFIVNGTVNNTSGEDMEFQSDLINNGTFTALSGEFLFTGGANQISGSSTKITLRDAIFDGVYSNNIDTLTIIDDLEGTGSLTNAANMVLEIGDNAYHLSTLVATAVPNEVIYNGDGSHGSQIGFMTDYYDLTINNTGGDYVVFSTYYQFDDYDSGVTVNVANHFNIQSDFYWPNYYDSLTGKDLTIAANAFYATRGRKSTVGAIPAFTGTYDLNVNSTMIFYDNGTQLMNTSGITFGNVISRSSSRKELNGNMDINGDLTIEASSYLDATASNYDINLAGNWISTTTHASYSLRARSAKVILDGSGAQSISCSGRGQEEFYDLTIANSGNTVTMSDDVAIGNQLDFSTSGFLNIDANTLTINNWDDGDIVGFATDRYAIINSSSVFTINGVDGNETANFPMGFSSSSLDFCRSDIFNNDNSNTSFSLSVCNYLNSIGSCSSGTQVTSDAVEITWNITSASTDADVSLFWDASKELTGFNRAASDIAHYIGSWNQLGSYTSSTNLSGSIYYRTENTTSFSPFTMTSDLAALPVELLYFTAILSGDVVDLNWETASETNNDYFTVERSSNGLNWEALSEIKGAGNSSRIIHYSEVDTKPFPGTSYYRIKQTDFNGMSEYSPVQQIIFNDRPGSAAIIYPNPSFDQIKIIGDELELSSIEIYDVFGKEVSAKTSIENNDQGVTIDLSNLSAGTYFIKTKTSVNRLNKL